MYRLNHEDRFLAPGPLEQLSRLTRHPLLHAFPILKKKNVNLISSMGFFVSSLFMMILIDMVKEFTTVRAPILDERSTWIHVSTLASNSFFSI
jgi:hypothetical protein